MNSAEVYALEKVLWYDSPTFNGALLAVVLHLCLSALIAEPVRMVHARRQDQARTEQPRLAVIARWVGLIDSALISKKHRTPYDWAASSYVIQGD